MAALATAIANIYEPEIWAKYFLEMTTEKSLLVQSGIAGSTPEIDAAASQGGRICTMPFWDDLSHDTAATDRSKVATDDDTSITPHGLTTGEDIAVKHFRTQSFSVSPIVRYVAGDDPAQVVISRFAKWWQKEEQRLLLKTLTGVYADSAIATALSNDVAGETTTTDPAKLIGSSQIEDTRFLLGDAYDKFTAIIMHSVCFKRLRALDLIDDVVLSTQDPKVPTYMGLRVLVDDGMTNVAGGTSGRKYHTFLFGAGAFARTDIALASGDPALEIYRQPLKGTGAGQLDVITRRYFLLHPRGVSYYDADMAGVSPSDAELAADNWTLAFMAKNIRFARLITNG
jgi:hypothetical protein